MDDRQNARMQVSLDNVLVVEAEAAEHAEALTLALPVGGRRQTQGFGERLLGVGHRTSGFRILHAEVGGAVPEAGGGK